MNIRVFCAIVGSLIVMGAANAQSVYVASSDGQFGQLNVLTGAYTLIDTPTVALGGIGFGTGGVLYGFAEDDKLYSVSPTGMETLVGPTGVNQGGGWGMGGAPDGTLYAQGGGELSTLNQSTGAATNLGTVGFLTAAVPAADANGNLYLNDSGTGQLFSIDKTNGASTLIGSLGAASNVDAMVWTGGTMYAIDFSGDIYSVNTSTAATTLVANYSVGNAGLIWAAASDFPAVPEPKSFAVLGFGLLLFLRRRKRS